MGVLQDAWGFIRIHGDSWGFTGFFCGFMWFHLGSMGIRGVSWGLRGIHRDSLKFIGNFGEFSGI